ncbi:hypothetical protein QUB37_24560 [Microcoleus sp. AT3-A2]|uniref:hypothetical protein n=1 Tax=Microcoleus sp. AT3-A2 TaxID=2818610 RepID=UPI002FD3808D
MKRLDARLGDRSPKPHIPHLALVSNLLDRNKSDMCDRPFVTLKPFKEKCLWADAIQH